MNLTHERILNETPVAEARRLRDAIYGPQTEKNWSACSIFWVPPEELAWLRKMTSAPVES